MPFSLVGDVYGVGSVTIEGDGVARRFVERSLPEILEGVRFPAEAYAGETRAGIVEDAHLLAWRRCECCSALTRMEDAVVGDERRMDVEVTKVVHQKGEVANGMILSAPHRTEVGDARVALADAEPCGLREVVVVLFADEVEDVVVLLLERLGQRVAVTDDGIGQAQSATDELLCRTIAATEEFRFLQDGKRNFVCREGAGG